VGLKIEGADRAVLEFRGWNHQRSNNPFYRAHLSVRQHATIIHPKTPIPIATCNSSLFPRRFRLKLERLKSFDDNRIQLREIGPNQNGEIGELNDKENIETDQMILAETIRKTSHNFPKSE
jgi:hypothetical protein